MASVNGKVLPIGSYLTIKAIVVDSKDKVKLSKRKFTVLVDRLVQDCQYVAKSQSSHEWRPKSPIRMFQTRKLYMGIFEGGMSGIPFGKDNLVHRFALSFSDILKQRSDHPGTTSWQYRRSESLDANGAQIELRLDVTLDFFWLNKPTNLEGTVYRDSTEDLELKLDKISNVVEGFKEVKQRLADANIDIGEIADRLASVVKDIHPIAALVVTVVSIPFKMWKNSQKYSKKASTLCEQVQRLFGYLQTMDTISSPSPALLDALVLAIEGLISASDALTEFSNTGIVERSVQALYDGTFDDLTQALSDSEKQLVVCVTIDIRAEQSRNQDTARLKSHLNPAELQPTGPQCHFETRKDVLEQIYTWVRSRDVSEKTLRIDGLPGTGKTTLASTVYNWCCEEGFTPAKFFFVGRPGKPIQGRTDPASDACEKEPSNAEKYEDPVYVWPTLAWQLAQTYPEIRKILVAMTRTGNLSTVIETQFERLVVPSINAATSSFEFSPLVIIIDALEEGMHKEPDVWASFIKTLGLFSAKFPDVNYRLILLSRDNQVVRDYVSAGVHTLHLSPANHKELSSVFSAKLGPGSDCKNPLSQHDVEQLSLHANGLFIWAATAIRYIRKGLDVAHHRMLDVIAAPKDSDPMNAVRNLYDEVLETAFRDLKPKEEEAVKLFLAIILVLTSPKPLSEIATYDDRLKILSERLVGDLLPLLSVTEDQTYTLAHLSIMEHITDRQVHFAIPTTAAHTILALRLVRKYRSIFVGAAEDILEYNVDAHARRIVILPLHWTHLRQAAGIWGRVRMRPLLHHVDAIATTGDHIYPCCWQDAAGVQVSPLYTNWNVKQFFHCLLHWLDHMVEEQRMNRCDDTDVKDIRNAGIVTFVPTQDAETGGSVETDEDSESDTDADTDEDSETDEDSDRDGETDEPEDVETDQRAETNQYANWANQQRTVKLQAASHILMHFTDDTIGWLDALERWLDPPQELAATQREDRSFKKLCTELAIRGYKIEDHILLGRSVHSSPRGSWGSRCHI